MTQDPLFGSAAKPTTASRQHVGNVTAEGDLAYKRILVPIDFSDLSQRTVSYALKFASAYNATLQLLHVFDVPDYVTTPYVRAPQSRDQVKSQIAAAEQEARENLTAVELQLLDREIKVEAYLRVGCPFDEIVQMANNLDVDLIIIGSHGHTGLTHLLVGSTAERVVEHAPCPVLVVKERRRRR